METAQITARFGASVRNFRRSIGISQEALAERADLHRTYIADIERGARNVTLKSIEKLAIALHISIPTLFLDISGVVGRSESPELAKRKPVEVLIVEDNLDDVELALRAFKLSHITNPLQVVKDGQEALDFIFCQGRFSLRKIEDRPPLVLLDLNLPKIGGLEVLRRIRADQRTHMIPVVVLTDSQLFNDKDACRRLGVETYIVKPTSAESFARATKELGMYWLLLDQPVQA